MKRSHAMRKNTRTATMRNTLRVLNIAGVAVLIAMLLKNRQQISGRMRIFNKHILNPVMLKFAGSSRTQFATIRHVGRRSGKPYETPIIVEPIVDGFVIALTYGPEVDWYRNVLAAGHCIIFWHGREYAVEKPEPIGIQTALPVFPLTLRLILRVLGTQHFLRMKYQVAAPTLETATA